jgi:hypothetical protein
MTPPDRKPSQPLSDEEKAAAEKEFEALSEAEQAELIKAAKKKITGETIEDTHLQAGLASKEEGPSGRTLGEVVADLLNNNALKDLGNQSEDSPADSGSEADASRE